MLRERSCMRTSGLKACVERGDMHVAWSGLLSPQETHLGCISVMLRNITSSTIMLDKMMDKWNICCTFKSDNHSYYDYPQTWVKTPKLQGF